jgi:hypothetical protein
VSVLDLAVGVRDPLKRKSCLDGQLEFARDEQIRLQEISRIRGAWRRVS